MKTLPFPLQKQCSVKRSQTAEKKQAGNQADSQDIKATAAGNRSPHSQSFFLPPPEEVLEDSTFKKTAKTIVKQMVNIRMVLDVTEYHADVYYNSQTGERVHAVHPLIRAGDFCLT